MLLKIDNLTKIYSGRKVVDGVSFNVDKGEIVGILGVNGAGKTTSFRMTVGMIKPSGGKVFFKGKDITSLPMYKRARLGMSYLSQEPSVFQGLSVKDNIYAILEFLNVPKDKKEVKIRDILFDLGLEHLADHKAYTLSGGERRRLEISRALITSPDLILLDEPFSGVDPKAVANIKKIISGLSKRGIGILLTDHNVHDTLPLTDRAYIINNGKVEVHGAPMEIVNDPHARKIYLGQDFKMHPIEDKKSNENIEI